MANERRVINRVRVCVCVCVCVCVERERGKWRNFIYKQEAGV